MGNVAVKTTTEGRALRFGQLYERIVLPNATGAVKEYGPDITFSGPKPVRNASLTLLDNGLVEFVVDNTVALIPTSAFKVMVLK